MIKSKDSSQLYEDHNAEFCPITPHTTSEIVDMSDKKLLVVFGATGQQSGSVITSMVNDPKTASQWKIRGITRDPSKPNAKALEAKGVETVTVRNSGASTTSLKL